MAAAVAGALLLLVVAYVAWPTLTAPRQDVPPPPPKPAPAPPAERLEHDRRLTTRLPAPEGAPNVVFVIGCTVRRDQTTPYGGPATTTPFLAELAEAGVRFDDALATSSWTREASVGLLTGHHAATFNLPNPNRGQSRRVLTDEATTLAEALAASGWVTLGITANPNLNHEYGFGQGFDHYRDSRAKGFALRNKIDGTEVVDLAMALLEGRSEAERARPFYLQLTLIDAHTPRHPRPDELAAFAEPGVDALVVEYRSQLRRVDDALRRLEERLRQAGHGPHDTLWVFVADHGEGLSMPAHHRGGHGKGMYESSVSIPWIVRGPGIPSGRAVAGLASGVDVTPTVLGLLGLPPLPDVPGRDWSTRLRGDTRPTDRERAYALSMFHGANMASIWTSETQCQRDYGTVGIKDHPLQTGCFDRRADPTFTKPFEHPALQAELEAWRDARLAEGARFPVVDAGEQDDVGKQLEALGYVEEE